MLTRVLENALRQQYLASNPRLNVDTPEIIRDVIYSTFNLAAARRMYPNYFDSAVQFRWWLATIAFTDLRVRLVQRREYAERIRILPKQQLQSFGWVVYDKMTVSEVARQLDSTSDEVERNVSDTFRFILE